MAIANRRVQSGWRRESNTHGNGVANPNDDGDGNSNARNNSDSNGDRDGDRDGDAYPNRNDPAAGDTHA